MWKLIIEQKRKSEFVNGVVTDKVSFENKDIKELAHLVCVLSESADVMETSYKIEKIKEGEEE